MTRPEEITSLIARMRRVLVWRRFAAAATRGALAGGALGLAILVLGKIVPSIPAAAGVAWICLAAGAVAGFAWAALGGSISSSSAALYLDRRLGTHERIVTVQSRPAHPLRPIVARDVAIPAALPQPPLPRETALLPAALFLLFAAGLLPEAKAAQDARGFVAVAAPQTVAGSGDAAPDGDASPDTAALLDALAKGELTPADARALQSALDAAIARPEERARLQDLLRRAEGGDRAAAREVAAALDRARGGSGGGGDAAAGSASEAFSARAADGAPPPALYPEKQHLIRAYYRALAREDER